MIESARFIHYDHTCAENATTRTHTRMLWCELYRIVTLCWENVCNVLPVKLGLSLPSDISRWWLCRYNPQLAEKGIPLQSRIPRNLWSLDWWRGRFRFPSDSFGLVGTTWLERDLKMAGPLLIRNVAKQLRNQVDFTVLIRTLTIHLSLSVTHENQFCIAPYHVELLNIESRELCDLYT